MSDNRTGADLDFWDIVAEPANLDTLRVGDLVGVEEQYNGKPWRRTVKRVSRVDTDPDGTRHLEIVDAPEVTEWPDIMIITGNRSEDTQ